MFDNLKELIEKNEQAFKIAEKEFRDNYLILMKEKHKSEEVGDLNGRDLYHGAMK